MGLSVEQNGVVDGKKKTTRFLIQRAALTVGEIDQEWALNDGAARAWIDVGEVEVPSGSHRRTTVQRALEQFEIDHGQLPAVFRVLDMDTAEPIPVKLESPPPPPEPVVKIG